MKKKSYIDQGIVADNPGDIAEAGIAEAEPKGKGDFTEAGVADLSNLEKGGVLEAGIADSSKLKKDDIAGAGIADPSKSKEKVGIADLGRKGSILDAGVAGSSPAKKGSILIAGVADPSSKTKKDSILAAGIVGPSKSPARSKKSSVDAMELGVADIGGKGDVTEAGILQSDKKSVRYDVKKRKSGGKSPGWHNGEQFEMSELTGLPG